jgi:Tfp pilus assembly protein PilO
MTAKLRRPATAGVLVGLLILGAWWQLLWNPQSSALSQAHTADQTASTGLIQAGQTLGHLKHLQTISPQLTALEEKLSNAVPNGTSFDTFLISLNQMADVAGVQLQSVAPTTPTVSTGGLSTVAISLSFSGGYFNVQRFLDELKSGSRLVIIDSLSEAPDSSGSGSVGSTPVAVSLRLHILSGLAPPPAITGLVPPALPVSSSGGQ